MYIPKLNSYFIHIPKCGGTSVELFFFKMHGYDIKEKNIWPQLLRYGNIGPRFHFGHNVPGIKYETQHVTAYHSKRANIKEFMESKYKFAFVRNPWHRFVSETFWKQQVLNMKNHTFQNQIQMQKNNAGNSFDHIRPHNAPMWKFVYDKDMNLLVDDVFKMEEMDKAEKKLSEVFNMEIKFGHHNKTTRKDYSEYLTPEIKKNLYPYIQKDLELFGYE